MAPGLAAVGAAFACRGAAAAARRFASERQPGRPRWGVLAEQVLLGVQVLLGEVTQRRAHGVVEYKNDDKLFRKRIHTRIWL